MHTKKMTAALLFAAVILPLGVFAADLRVGRQAAVSPGENILDDVYVVGGNATSAGTVRGDAVGAGGTILMSGSVGGDVLAAGGNISVLANVADDVRVAGGNILIGGTVASDVVAAGGQIELRGERIGGDAIASGGSIRVDTPIEGDAHFAGGEVYINAPIAGNVDVKADRVTLGSGALISGTLTYSAKREAQMESGAEVQGGVRFTPRAEKGFLASLPVWILIKFLMTFVTALIVSLVLRRYTGEVVARGAERPWFEIGRGLLAFVVLPIASVILLATIIGIPFGILGILSFIALILWGSILAPVVLGSFLYKWMSGSETHEVSWKTILLGAAALSLVGLIPYVGWIAPFLFLLLALGATLRLKWEVLREWR